MMIDLPTQLCPAEDLDALQTLDIALEVTEDISGLDA